MPKSTKNSHNPGLLADGPRKSDTNPAQSGDGGKKSSCPFGFRAARSLLPTETMGLLVLGGPPRSAGHLPGQAPPTAGLAHAHLSRQGRAVPAMQAGGPRDAGKLGVGGLSCARGRQARAPLRMVFDTGATAPGATKKTNYLEILFTNHI